MPQVSVLQHDIERHRISVTQQLGKKLHTLDVLKIHDE